MKDKENFDILAYGLYSYDEPNFTIQTFITGDRKTKLRICQTNLKQILNHPMSVENIITDVIDNSKDSNGNQRDGTPSEANLIDAIEEEYNKKWFEDFGCGILS